MEGAIISLFVFFSFFCPICASSSILSHLSLVIHHLFLVSVTHMVPLSSQIQQGSEPSQLLWLAVLAGTATVWPITTLLLFALFYGFRFPKIYKKIGLRMSIIFNPTVINILSLSIPLNNSEKSCDAHLFAYVIHIYPLSKDLTFL